MRQHPIGKIKITGNCGHIIHRCPSGPSRGIKPATKTTHSSKPTSQIIKRLIFCLSSHPPQSKFIGIHFGDAMQNWTSPGHPPALNIPYNNGGGTPFLAFSCGLFLTSHLRWSFFIIARGKTHGKDNEMKTPSDGRARSWAVIYE
jgi:hypothetical protein